MKILEFAFTLGKLKKLKRTGWLRHKIVNPESVAEHSYRVAVLAMFLAPKVGADTHKAIKMALLHDLGEAEIGDIVTTKGGKRLDNHSEKLEKERNAMEMILSLIDAKEYLDLFDEYEENKTKEAQLIKQLDRLEMAIQALEYEKEHSIKLEEFFETTRSEVNDAYLKQILTEVEALRKKIDRTKLQEEEEILDALAELLANDFLEMKAAGTLPKRIKQTKKSVRK